MRIFIIGGSGMTGPHLVRRLLDQGHAICLLYRTIAESPLLSGAEQWQSDKALLPTLRDRLKAWQPRVIMHMMAFCADDASMLLDVARGIVERLVIISSMDVYRAYGILSRTEPGPYEPMPLTETMPLRSSAGIPNNGYAKMEVERIAASDPHLPCTILRYPAVYGPGDEQHRLRSWIARMDAGRSQLLLGQPVASWRWSMGYVENVASAAALAIVAEEAIGRIFNIGDPEVPTIEEWIGMIGAHIGWTGEIRTCPQQDLPRHLASNCDFRQDMVSDTSRIRSLVGFSEPIPAYERLVRTVAWERAHPLTAAQLAEELDAEDRVLKIPN